MASIADRIQWVLDSGRVPSGSAWAVKAKLPRTYIATFQFRERQGKPIEAGVATVVALARAAGVSFLWLATGEGSPDDTPAIAPANLRALLDRLPVGTYPAPLVAQAMLIRELIGEADLPEDVWQDYLDGLRREARRVGLELASSRLDRRGVKR